MTTDPTSASMRGPLSEAAAAAARIRAYLDACPDADSFGREIRWELRDADGRPYDLPRADLVAVLDGLAAESKDCEILEEGYINAMDDYGNQLTEVEQLRARVGVLEGQLATAQGQLARVRENQIAWTHGLNDYAERQHQNSDKDRDGYAAIRAAGAAFGAGQILQQLLMELGEVEFDEAAECTWDIVSKWPETARALGLDGGGSDAE